MKTLSIMTSDNDYSYIEVFIKFLKEIIDIIKDLFSSVTKSDDAATTTTTEKA